MDNTIGPLPRVRFGDWIGEGWNMFAEQWKVWVVNTLILLLVTLVPVIGIYIFTFVALASAGAGSAGLGLFMVAVIFAVVVLLVLLSIYLVAGMYNTAFKQLRGEAISTSDVFAGGDSFPRVLGAAFVVGILVTIGALLCIIPAFIVAGALYFTLPLVVERRLSVGEAIQASRDATRGDLFKFVLFAFVVSLIAQSGSYLCYVGMLVTWPLQYTIAAIAYRDVFGVPGARSFASKVAPPHAYGAPPPSGYQPAPPQQWPGYSSTAPPSAVYESPPTAVPPSTAPQSRVPTGAVQQGPTGEITACPDCKAELPASARFCARCGRNLVQQ